MGAFKKLYDSYHAKVGDPDGGPYSSLFRSEEMELTQLFLQPDVAFDIIATLGEVGIAQFVDLNEGTSPFLRKFVTEIKTCEELDRKLKYIEAELNKDDIFIKETKEIPKTLSLKELHELEKHLVTVEDEVRQLSNNSRELREGYIRQIEAKEVLEKASGFFSNYEELIQDEEGASAGRLHFVAGVIDREKFASFERVLWRVGRGNIYVRQSGMQKPIADPETGKDVFRTVFVAFYQGEQLHSRVNKICVGFKASVYSCPENKEARAVALKKLEVDIADSEMVMRQTQDFRMHVLKKEMDSLFNWTLMVRKVKAIYFVMNMFNFDITNKCFIAECWIPKLDLAKARQILSDVSKSASTSISSFMNIIDTPRTPPTYIRTNKFTGAFQMLIESYAVLTYHEVNPGLITVVTFPFLFAVMFGDVGHGAILFLIGLAFWHWEKPLSKIAETSEIFGMFFSGRYIIVLMGLFSMYTGFIYNDVFSKSVNIFGSSWIVHTQDHDVHDNLRLTFMLRPENSTTGSPYPFGLDPVWMQSKNKIIFHNSYKMKMSIIIGIVHMIFGLSLSVVNARKFKKIENILFEFIPQVVFLVSLFGWLVILMFLKWFMYSAQQLDDKSTSCAPSVLILFINMVLFKSAEVKGEFCKEFMFEGQSTVQMVLLFVGLAMIPIMLLGKPLYIRAQRKKKEALKLQKNDNNGVVVTLNGKSVVADHEEHEEPMSEIWMHQGIHTIEYVLSTVSHTASYLRLWALSLAHGELSEVLYKVFSMSFTTLEGYMGIPMLFFVFTAWSTLSLFILVMMEGLSAFLHTLRLHWVEFMNKFFEGSGYPFQPFYFKALLEAEDIEEREK